MLNTTPEKIRHCMKAAPERVICHLPDLEGLAQYVLPKFHALNLQVPIITSHTLEPGKIIFYTDKRISENERQAYEQLIKSLARTWDYDYEKSFIELPEERNNK